MKIELRDKAFDPFQEIGRYQKQVLGQTGKYGALANFVGTMRDFNDGRTVQAMTLEHYPGMTEQHLRRISEEAKQRWDIIDTLVIHRVGEVWASEAIVLVAVWSAHRAAAFDACRYLIEELKTRAPFWKNERVEETTHWVEHNTPAA